MSTTKQNNKKNHASKKSTSAPHHAPKHEQHHAAARDAAELETDLGHADAGANADAQSAIVDAALSPEQQIAAYEALGRVRPRAMALRIEEVQPYRVVPAVAMVNVRKLKMGLARFRGEMAAALPLLDLTHYDTLEQTTLGLAAAANDADNVSSDGEVRNNLAKARDLRARMLPVLHGLALNGHVPMKAYQDIAAGSGARDVAQDCVDLPVAFRKYAAKVEGKHPISDADLAAADAVGAWLLLNMNTKGARVPKSAPVEAIELRNRVATLLVRDYEVATLIAHYFLGDAYAEVASPLRSRFVPRRATATTPDPTVPTPVPAPAPVPTPSPAPGAPIASPAPIAPAATEPSPSNGAAPAAGA